MLKKAALYLLLVLLWQQSFAYRDVLVLTHLNKAEQKDTMGFNLVESLPPLVYKLLEQNKITLWDSPDKTLNIGFQSLKTIEKNSNTSFTAISDLFFNELWSSNRKRTRFDILGFSFINKNGKGEPVSYGFVDMADIYPHLADSIIFTNANGGANTTFYTALYSRNYHFNVVQFGKNTFKKDITEALRIKNKAFNGRKKIINQTTLPQQKRIVYEIIKSNKSTLFYKEFEQFLSDNPEFFYNNGGDKLFSPMDKAAFFSISRIEVVETWEKTDNTIAQQPLSVILYFNNMALPPISVQEFINYRMKVDFLDLKSALREKSFDYLLKKINHQDIAPAQSGKYVRALQNYFWTQVTEYVKYD